MDPAGPSVGRPQLGFHLAGPRMAGTGQAFIRWTRLALKRRPLPEFHTINPQPGLHTAVPSRAFRQRAPAQWWVPVSDGGSQSGFHMAHSAEPGNSVELSRTFMRRGTGTGRTFHAAAGPAGLVVDTGLTFNGELSYGRPRPGF